MSAEDYLGLPTCTNAAPAYIQAIQSRLHKLAVLESSLARAEDGDLLFGYGLYGRPSDVLLGQKIASMSSTDKYSALHRLAANGVLLSPEAFTESMDLDKTAAIDLRQSSKNIYRDTYRRYSHTSFAFPASVLSRLSLSPLSKSAEWNLPLHTIAPYKLDRVKTASLVKRGMFLYAHQNVCEVPRNFRDLAESYALYKAAALCCFPLDLQEFGEKAAVLQTLSLTRLAG
jgi:hypothetical protein